MKLIFVHGLGQDKTSFDSTSKYLKNIEYHSLDLKELDFKKMSYNNLKKELFKYFNSFKDPINICGLSLGAILCLDYAINYSDKVKNLILIAPQYKMPKTILRVQGLIFKLLPKRFFNKGFKKEEFLALNNSIINLDFSNDLIGLDVKTLILCGGKDKINLKASKDLNSILKNSYFIKVSDGTHELNIQKPKELAFYIERFLLHK